MSSLLDKGLCDSLSKDEFGDEIQKNSWKALKYSYVCAKLSDTQFDYCVKEWPRAALLYRHAYARLTPYQKSWLKKNNHE
jgi:hypothetical protein